ncbi:NUDIX hydrolase [Evansella halocellulosilytica]|uniref:NUDIX hydrolase n=1 Tax=Evansella halocellulosilytica TaxID=2011013 RepID=UPI000BB8CA2E|nr:NUDIX hydrolase [Evansella halocellulosilytica]
MGYVEDLRKIVGHRPLILVGAVVVVVDEHGRILLQQRKYPKGTWGLPGGLLELTESTEEAARREVYEETGLTVNDLTLLNVYSGKDYFVRAENGDEFYAVTVAYSTKNYEGKLEADRNESVQLTFCYPKDFPENFIGSHRRILDDYVDHSL